MPRSVKRGRRSNIAAESRLQRASVYRRLGDSELVRAATKFEQDRVKREAEDKEEQDNGGAVASSSTGAARRIKRRRGESDRRDHGRYDAATAADD